MYNNFLILETLQRISRKFLRVDRVEKETLSELLIRLVSSSFMCQSQKKYCKIGQIDPNKSFTQKLDVKESFTAVTTVVYVKLIFIEWKRLRHCFPIEDKWSYHRFNIGSIVNCVAKDFSKTWINVQQSERLIRNKCHCGERTKSIFSTRHLTIQTVLYLLFFNVV